MGFLPRDPLFHDDTKGAQPPLDSPAYTETCPEILWTLPMVRYKKYVSINTPRNIYPFNRVSAGVSLIDPL